MWVVRAVASQFVVIFKDLSCTRSDFYVKINIFDSLNLKAGQQKQGVYHSPNRDPAVKPNQGNYYICDYLVLFLNWRAKK